MFNAVKQSALPEDRPCHGRLVLIQRRLVFVLDKHLVYDVHLEKVQNSEDKNASLWITRPGIFTLTQNIVDVPGTFGVFGVFAL